MMKKIKDYIVNFINGFCMSLADSVPGVSGGTVAFILGFYDKFIAALDDLFRGKKEEKKKAFKYLFKLGLGWVVGLLLAIVFLSSLFDKHIYEMSSLFIGFILFAIPIVIKEEKSSLKNNYRNLIFMLMGILFVAVITYLNRASGTAFNIDSFNIATALYVFLAAAIAICAMILPGISGSTLLLIFGIYVPIVVKVKAFLTLDFSVIPILIVFGLGMVFGIVFFTKLIRKCLDKKRSATIYAILGMMLGSFYSIVMGPTTLDVPLPHLTLKTFNPLYFILGGVIILGLEGLKNFMTKEKE